MAAEDLAARKLLPDNWREKAAGLKVMVLRSSQRFGHLLSIDPAKLPVQLDEIKAQGFQAIEIFGPTDALRAASGLDVVNYYRIPPSVGTNDDFRRLVRTAHSKGLAVVIFLNLGYFSIESPDWIEACKDKKAGKDTDKVKWFLWSDKADTPHPPTQEDIYLSQAERDRGKDYWGWFHSEQAGCYFWSRWYTSGSNRARIPLPQTDWASKEWRDEADRVLRHWMNMGIDGMLIDAPLCYPNQTWEHNRRVASVVNSYGNTLLQPEGGRDAAWMTDAGYNCVQNYGFFYAPGTRIYNSRNALVEAINTGNPREIEPCLRYYHDEVVQAGAVCYDRLLNRFSGNLAKRHLQMAILAGIGDIIVYATSEGNPDSEETRILQLKAGHPALYPVALRRTLQTDADDKYYAFLKTARDGSQRVLCVFNLQETPQTVRVDTSVVSATEFVDLQSGSKIAHADPFKPTAIELPAYGYRFFEALPAGEPRLAAAASGK
jgi:glycosidase